MKATICDRCEGHEESQVTVYRDWFQVRQGDRYYDLCSVACLKGMFRDWTPA